VTLNHCDWASSLQGKISSTTGGGNAGDTLQNLDTSTHPNNTKSKRKTKFSDANVAPTATATTTKSNGKGPAAASSAPKHSTSASSSSSAAASRKGDATQDRGENSRQHDITTTAAAEEEATTSSVSGLETLQSLVKEAEKGIMQEVEALLKRHRPPQQMVSYRIGTSLFSRHQER